MHHWTIIYNWHDKVCSLNVIWDLKWFPAYKYMFKFEMYIHERKFICTTSKIHKMFTFIPRIVRSVLMFLVWILLIHSCKFSWIVKPYICSNVGSLHFRHAYLEWITFDVSKSYHEHFYLLLQPTTNYVDKASMPRFVNSILMFP